MRLLIYVAVWRRPEITEICFLGIARLREYSKHSIKPFAVISEISMIALCKKYDIDYVLYPNKPLGGKKNYGLSVAMKRHDFDYMIELGSDDLLKNEYFDALPWDRDVMMIKQIYFIDSTTGYCRLFSASGPKIGAGRAISRKALDACAPIWHTKQGHGLDGYSTMHLAFRSYLPKTYPTAKPVAIDIKSAVNIWSYNSVKMLCAPALIDDVLDGLSKAEITAIKCLVSKRM